ncbi:formate dehydrogenase accessory sulfurtransferase FdhD [Romboutsia hominis]|uniref:FdhD/NarQ family n=2 Tax=Peptostreptococcaceae TaxID=186804 RepID=A0A2P2BSB9_9FIRM|nr:formate dehydrogenase accessory sulfurtransferase FdhD [Romboutsia hominis]CEI73243.1 FdhD/NarQ family [Romboutsia hominis]
MDVVKKYKIKRYINGELIEVDDDIVVEYLFTIYINEYEYITLICTPSSLLHLAVGFLYSDEIITSYNDINSINVFEKEGYVDIK